MAEEFKRQHPTGKKTIFKHIVVNVRIHVNSRHIKRQGFVIPKHIRNRKGVIIDIELIVTSQRRRQDLP